MTKRMIVEGKTKNEKIDSRDFTEKVLNNLVKEIKMKKLTEPLVVRGNSVPGLTGVVIIETSHIILHTYTETGKIALDVYSVKNFDKKKVIKFLDKAYGLKNIKIKTVK